MHLSRPSPIQLLVVSLVLGACGDDASTTDTSVADTITTDTTVADTITTDTTTTETTVADSDDTVDTALDTTPIDSGDVAVDPSYGFAVIALSAAVDITSDGAFAIFWDAASGSGDTHLYNVATGDLTLETQVGPPARDFPTAVSDNIRITALEGEPVNAGLWTEGNVWRRLGSLFADGCGEDESDPKLGDIGGAWDVSADGEIVVGMLWDDCSARAFRWSEDGETRDFRLLDELGEVTEGVAHANRATVVSDDGLVAAGFAQTAVVDRWPAMWSTVDGSGELLETEVFPADAPGEILAIESDGSAAVGVWNQSGFLWTKAEGVTDLGALAEVLPGEPTYANVIAANGTLVFGVSGGGGFGIGYAFVWTKEKGMRKLADVAAAHGVTIPAGLRLSNVLGASSDGAVLIGSVDNDELFTQASYVLRLPAAAYAD